MKRRASAMEFAQVWGEVSRWGQQDRDNLMELMQQGLTPKATEPRKRKPRKPKPGAPEGGA